MKANSFIQSNLQQRSWLTIQQQNTSALNLNPVVDRRTFLMGLGSLLITGCGSSADPVIKLLPSNGSAIQLESPAFMAGELIPARYTCDSENISPPLRWGALPEGACSLTLILSDPDAPGKTFIHWMVYDLSVTDHQLSEGLPTQPRLIDGGIQAKNDFEEYGYGGPCPPNGTHRYFFRILALDKRLDLAPESSKTDIFAAIDGHVIAAGELMGQYARQT